jgi:hypothetical protein
MIDGAHFLLFSENPRADQAALQEILQCRSVGAEPGRRILALPPAEIATHAGSENLTHRHGGHDLLGLVLYLTCDDLAATIASLKTKGLECSEVVDMGFGSKTTVKLPSGGEIALYQPSHETAFERA